MDEEKGELTGEEDTGAGKDKSETEK